MRSTLTTISELVGFGLIAVAAWRVSVELGLVVAGVALVVAGYLGGRS